MSEIRTVTLRTDTCTAVLTNLGARLLELHVPDRNGDLADIVLQRPTFDAIATDDTYMGATAGRFANRIRGGRFRIDGQDVQLSLNEGSHHLHGGLSGFDRKLWSTEFASDSGEVTFRRISPDGEEGYPGTLTTTVTYRLDGSALVVDIRATTDAATVVNIVHHSYFNLGGHDSGTVLGHDLQMQSSFYLPVDDDLLPTGEILAVAGTPFDFRTTTPIGKNIAGATHSGTGYDHNWILAGTGMREVAILSDPRSGRRLAMSTDQPGIQMYAGGYLEGVSGKTPVASYPAFAGLALESQTFPDAVNHPHFPRADLQPGQTYHNSVRFDFSTF